MSLKQDGDRSDVHPQSPKSLSIVSGSDNGCKISLPVRIQTQFRRGIFEGLTTVERQQIETRFWLKVKKTPQCWLWTGTVDSHLPGRGYGKFAIRLDGRCRQYFAHRVSWELFRESIPAEKCVLHRCDVPACVRVEHLFIGTQGDNVRDAASKDRLTVPRHRSLTLEQRLEIMAAPRDRETGGELARKFGVSKVVICHVRKGRFIGSGVEHEHVGVLKQHKDIRLERVPSVQLEVRGEVA